LTVLTVNRRFLRCPGSCKMGPNQVCSGTRP
jgi:hypothetical protein